MTQSSKRLFPRSVLALFTIFGISIACAAVGAKDVPKTLIAAEGEPRMPVVVGRKADAGVRAAADTLASYLERITGAAFAVSEDDGSKGIVFGTCDDFDALPLDDVAFGDGPFERDHYVIRSTGDGLYLLGATPLAARFAMWDFLHRLGHRQFFPTETWEIVPEKERLEIAVDVREQADYITRDAPRGAPRMNVRTWAQEAWREWQIRNRTVSGFNLRTGHSYKTIIRRNRGTFEENPEYLALVDGKRQGNKFCISNEGLRNLVVEDAIQRLRANPELDSISMDPSDGGGWCECRQCAEMGSVSGRVVILANEVAEAINELGLGDKYVGMYAYNHHSPPPEIDVHPNVIVSLATSFTRGGYTFGEIFEGWSDRANMLGLREYYGLTVWHYSLPAKSNASDLARLRDTIPRWHSKGARFMNAESDDTWGANGLGYYLAARMLWDTGEAERMDALVEDFLEKSFGPAKQPMGRFYQLIDRGAESPWVPGKRRPLNDDRVGRMYRLLDQAWTRAEDRAGARARIRDLILYTRYVDLYRRYKSAPGPKRQEAFDAMMRFAWRIRERMMAESVWLARKIRRVAERDEHVELGESFGANRPADRHRRNADKPFETDKIESILSDGVARHEIIDLDVSVLNFEEAALEPAGFESEAERGQPLQMHFKSGGRGGLTVYLGTRDRKLPSLYLSAGNIYRYRGPVRWELTDVENGENVSAGEVPPGPATRESREAWRNDPATRKLDLQVPEAGLYRLEITNTGQGFFWDYEPRDGTFLSVRADARKSLSRNWLDRHYFYVPEGTERIVIDGALRQKHAEGWRPAEGERIPWKAIRREQNFSIIPVPEGRDGKVWAFETRHDRSSLRFINVPGLLAYHPQELLVPERYAREIEQRGDEATFHRK